MSQIQMKYFEISLFKRLCLGVMVCAFTSFLVFLCCLPTSCENLAHPPNSAGENQKIKTFPESLLSAILPLAEIITSENPALVTLESFFQSKAIDAKEKNNFTLVGPGYRTNVFLRTENGTRTMSEISLNPDYDRYLTFKDVAGVLGTWKLIHESKTSSVLFFHKNPLTNKMAYIYVHLLDPPRFPKSMVLSIKIRRGEPSDDI